MSPFSRKKVYGGETVGLDEEIKIRHGHTHEQFLNLVLDTGYDIYDPQDALLDLQNNEHARKMSMHARG